MTDLTDQQLAGLLMITACPLSYVLAGVVLAAQMMRDLARTSGTRETRKPSVVG
jgi:cytochrome c oxidase assembly factor CtaG